MLDTILLILLSKNILNPLKEHILNNKFSPNKNKN